MRVTIDLDDLDERVLLTDMLDIEQWIRNLVTQKLRKVMERRCDEALGPGSPAVRPLEAPVRQQIAVTLASQGVVAGNVKQLPPGIKRQIMSLAETTSVAQRNQELDPESQNPVDRA